MRPTRLPSTLSWIETEKPYVEQIAGLKDRIREVVPNAKLVHDNAPFFNWTLNFPQQVFDFKNVSGYGSAAGSSPRSSGSTSPTTATLLKKPLASSEASAMPSP